MYPCRQINNPKNCTGVCGVTLEEVTDEKCVNCIVSKEFRHLRDENNRLEKKYTRLKETTDYYRNVLAEYAIDRIKSSMGKYNPG